MGLSPLFIFHQIFPNSSQRAKGRHKTSCTSFGIPLITCQPLDSGLCVYCISGWRVTLLTGIPVCPPIGASIAKCGYVPYPPFPSARIRPCITCWERRKKKGVSHSLLGKEQRTMSSLFALLRCLHLQFELCNPIWRRTRPVTQAREGRLSPLSS